jgi:hypothetical protein
MYLKPRKTSSEMHKTLRTDFGENSNGRTHISESILNSDAWEIQLKTVKVQVFPWWVPFHYESMVQKEFLPPGSTVITARTGLLCSGQEQTIIIPYMRIWFRTGQCCTQEFCSGGVQQIQLWTEGRENGDLGVVAP